jgi:hypothetical protein
VLCRHESARLVWDFGLPAPYPECPPPVPTQLHVVTRLWLELTRQLVLLDRSQQMPAGADIHDRMITAAVYVGMMERQAMTATRLAAATGLPRTTIIRRLEVLEASGTLERRGRAWRTPPRLLTAMDAVDLRPITALVRTSAGQL